MIELLKIAHLGEDFADKLHGSVRDTYIECYQRSRQELEKETRD